MLILLTLCPLLEVHYDHMLIRMIVCPLLEVLHDHHSFLSNDALHELMASQIVEYLVLQRNMVKPHMLFETDNKVRVECYSHGIYFGLKQDKVSFPNR